MPANIHDVDFLVVGSGSGGLTAALTAQHAGLSTLVIEKTDKYGGNSSRSGGGIWVPGHFLQASMGVEDSIELGRTYMAATVGKRTPQNLQDAFLKNAPEMVLFLQNNSVVKFHPVPGYSDYYPELPGGLAVGRTLECDILSTRKLGPEWRNMRTNPLFMGPMYMGIPDFAKLGMFMTTWTGRWVLLKVMFRTLFATLRRVKLLTMGGALIGRLRLSMLLADIPLWLDTPMQELIHQDGKIIGAIVNHEGQQVEIHARKGVLLASGGFEKNPTMRTTYQQEPISTEWTSGAPGNTGDAINAGLKIGAKLDLMEDAWWMPTSMPNGEPFPHVNERAYPGGIMVDMAGKRFMNESAPYHEAVHIMYAHQVNGKPTIPAWFIMDQRMRDKYLWATFMPGMKFPKKMYESGYVTSAGSIPELAEKLGLDPDALRQTVETFNNQAQQGVDSDFHRGVSAYDHYYGDPANKPNPNLHALDKPPFHAIRLYPGDIGTKGGLVIDECARVLRQDGSVIDGLFATGNTSASVMGNTYPGPGATIAPSMTFGYIAARVAAGIHE